MQGTGKGVPYESDEQLRQIQHRGKRLPTQTSRKEASDAKLPDRWALP